VQIVSKAHDLSLRSKEEELNMPTKKKPYTESEDNLDILAESQGLAMERSAFESQEPETQEEELEVIYEEKFTEAASASGAGKEQIYDAAYQAQTKSLKGKSEPCGGDLCVVTFEALQTSKSQLAPFQPKPLPGVRITVTNQSGGFQDFQFTDKDGEACWNDIETGKYLVAAQLPQGYNQPKSYSISVGGSKPTSKASTDLVEVKESQETRVEIGFAPEPAIINLRTTYSSTFCKSPGDVGVLEGARVDAYQGDERIACVNTDKKGTQSISVQKAGLVEIVSFPVNVGGRTFFPLQSHTIHQLEPGKECDIELQYSQKPAEIQVSACLLDANGVSTQKTLPNVGFQLRKGRATSGPPLREARTGRFGPVVFGPLEEGDYTLQILPPPGMDLELVRPRDGTVLVNVCCGQTLKLTDQVCFGPSLGRIQVTILNDELNTPLKGVPVLLEPADGGLVHQAVTDDNGIAAFDRVPGGDFVAGLQGEKITLANGDTWILSPGSPVEQPISVTPASARTLEFRLMRDIHRIYGTALQPDGEPLPDVTVQIQDANGVQVALVNTDSEGNYEWIADQPGLYYVSVLLDPGAEPARRFPARVNFPVKVNPYAGGPGGGGRGGLGARRGQQVGAQVKDAVGDLTSYPLLTESTGGLAPSPAAGTTAAGPGLGQTVQTALREVLSWRPRASNVQGFRAALDQSFAEKEDEYGTKQYIWVQRSYAVQADLGAVTGAQASILTRAKAAYDQSIPILDGLVALRSDADVENVEAAREIVRSYLTELINELGQEGGPRVQRVDSIFLSLLGPTGAIDPDKVTGALGGLRDVYGLTSAQVNTIDEERNLTNYQVLVDYVVSLKLSWDNQRRFFDRVGKDVFLGTQLVLVSRALGVVAESVQETAFAMDSVFLGEAERQTVQLEYAGEPPLFISELLAWVDHFATEEGPRLIRDGGKTGIKSLQPVAKQLADLVSDAQLQPDGQQDPAKLPASFRTTRVQRALAELANHMDDVTDLISQF
jgi:hypothetical protein